MSFDPRDPQQPAQRLLKLDFAEPPKPKAVTPEGFRDYEGIASIYDTVLDYPREAPLVRQLRPASALDDAAVASGIGKPIVNSHPRVKGERVWVLPKNAKLFTDGVILNMRREDAADGTPQLHVEFRVFDHQLMADIDAGKVDLSPGYDCKTVPRSGVTPSGEHYDAVQEGPIVINHLAVEYRGRNPGARIKADGQDEFSMDEIIALIESGKLKPEDLQALADKALAAKAAAGGGEPAPANAAPASSDTAQRLSAIEAELAALKGSKKTDAAEPDVEALAERVAKSASGKIQNIAAARALGTPILGAPKVDAMDDVLAIHRDVVTAVMPEQKALAEAHYAAGETVALASLAQVARAVHNKKITTDSADAIDESRSQRPEGRKQAEARLAQAYGDKKGE